MTLRSKFQLASDKFAVKQICAPSPRIENLNFFPSEILYEDKIQIVLLIPNDKTDFVLLIWALSPHTLYIQPRTWVLYLTVV